MEKLDLKAISKEQRESLLSAMQDACQTLKIDDESMRDFVKTRLVPFIERLTSKTTLSLEQLIAVLRSDRLSMDYVVSSDFEGKTPTDEQETAIALAMTGESLLINAYAGAAKTYTVSAFMSYSAKPSVMIVFNKRAQEDTAGRLRYMQKAQVFTTHALAVKWLKAVLDDRCKDLDLGSNYDSYQRVKSEMRRYSLEIERILPNGRRAPFYVYLTEYDCYKIICAMISTHCSQAGDNFRQSMAKCLPKTIENKLKKLKYTHELFISDSEIVEITASFFESTDIVKRAEALYRRYANIDFIAKIKMCSFDIAFKLWTQSDYQFASWNTVVLDEAQDTVPALIELLQKVQDVRQLVVVGDEFQQIYEWRGAVNAMSAFTLTNTTLLSTSFRYSADIAEVCSKHLSDAYSREIAIQSFVEAPQDNIRTCERLPSNTDAILVLENRIGLGYLLASIQPESKFRITFKKGFFDDTIDILKDYDEFKRTGANKNATQTFFNFTKEEFEGFDMSSIMSAVMPYYKQHGLAKTIAVLEGNLENSGKDIVLSTVHAAKGLEWDNVYLDFCKSSDHPVDVNVAYVGITRAKKMVVLNAAAMNAFGIQVAKLEDVVDVVEIVKAGPALPDIKQVESLKEDNSVLLKRLAALEDNFAKLMQVSKQAAEKAELASAKISFYDEFMVEHFDQLLQEFKNKKEFYRHMSGHSNGFLDRMSHCIGFFAVSDLSKSEQALFEEYRERTDTPYSFNHFTRYLQTYFTVYSTDKRQN